MSVDLTARLLAEIERRERGLNRDSTVNAAFHHPVDLMDRRTYLAALRKIVELHEPDSADPRVCFLCGYSDGAWPCDTVAAVAEALEVAP